MSVPCPGCLVLAGWRGRGAVAFSTVIYKIKFNYLTFLSFIFLDNPVMILHWTKINKDYYFSSYKVLFYISFLVPFYTWHWQSHVHDLNKKSQQANNIYYSFTTVQASQTDIFHSKEIKEAMPMWTGKMLHKIILYRNKTVLTSKSKVFNVQLS